MKLTRRPTVSLVTETGIFLRMSSPTLKSAAFGSSLSLPLYVGEAGVLVCESVGKTDLLWDHYDSKNLWGLLICHSLAIIFLVLPHLPSC